MNRLIILFASFFFMAPADAQSVKKIKIEDLATYIKNSDHPLVLSFWATWCGPCVAEMPHLESQIWQKKKDKKFAFISIGREHSTDELKPFRAKHKLTFPMAGDPKREVYGLYAEAYIPRTLLIDGEGRIVRQVVGYEEEEFKALLKSIDDELAKLK